jgi:Ser/Thr protein kinase RdoA (MazF antagonist)
MATHIPQPGTRGVPVACSRVAGGLGDASGGGGQRDAVFPVTHSVLAAGALVSDLLPRYGVRDVAECRLLNRGLTDTYRITTGRGERLILRAYRAGARTDADVHYELEALNHLKARGAPVSVPIPDRAGTFVQAVAAPEGRRQVVLFSFVPGDEPYHRDELALAQRYGRGVAVVHAASDDFRSAHQRFRIDLHELLDKPLAAIGPVLGRRAEDWRYVRDLAARLRDGVRALPEDALEWGFCHGDFHGGNCHVDGETLTFFDFDFCGPGWRAYDVAVFLWGNALLAGIAKAERRWRAFLRGYREVRTLRALDLQAVPLFVAIRHLFFLGVHTGNGAHWGYGWLNDRYFDRHLKFLRQWEPRRLGRPIPRSWRRP